jgi:hypothetical protein
MSRRTAIITAFILALSSALVFHDVRADTYPLHNPDIGLDVDGNRLVNKRDAELIIDLLLRSGPVLPVETFTIPLTAPSLYYNTSNDRTIGPLDAGIVIQHVLNAPEPGSLVLSGFALLALLFYAARRRTAAASS